MVGLSATSSAAVAVDLAWIGGQTKDQGVGSRRLVPQVRVRPHSAVVLPTAFDDDRRFRQRVENLSVQQLVAQRAIEALAIAVLLRRSRLDERRLCTYRSDPPPHDLGDEFRAFCWQI